LSRCARIDETRDDEARARGRRLTAARTRGQGYSTRRRTLRSVRT
jgi:hypothetical protein